MAKKYVVKKGYEGCDVIVSKPLNGRSGLFELNKCNQRDLKYLHDVVRYEGVIIIDDGKDERQS